MKKSLSTLLLEAERAFDEKCETFGSAGGFLKGERNLKPHLIWPFIEETLLSILSEAERATEVGQESNIVTFGDGEPLNVTVGFNLALNKVKSLWREWRGNLK